MHLKYQMACVTETMAALIAKAAASVPDIVCTRANVVVNILNMLESIPIITMDIFFNCHK